MPLQLCLDSKAPGKCVVAPVSVRLRNASESCDHSLPEETVTITRQVSLAHTNPDLLDHVTITAL
jgi:hypothetical protein